MYVFFIQYDGSLLVFTYSLNVFVPCPTCNKITYCCI